MKFDFNKNIINENNNSKAIEFLINHYKKTGQTEKL